MIKINEMSKKTGISRQTIYNKIAELEKNNLIERDAEGVILLKDDAEKFLLDNVKKTKNTSKVIYTENLNSQVDKVNNEEKPVDTTTTTKKYGSKIDNELVNELLKEKQNNIDNLVKQVEYLQNQVDTLQQTNAELTGIIATSLSKLTEHTFTEKTDAVKQIVNLQEPSQTKKTFWQRLLNK